MNQKVLKTLEYYKIIDRLTDCAASEPGKKMCRELTPSSNFNEIVQTQTETADAVTRVRQKGSLSLAGVRDVRDSLKRLEIGSSLSIMELLSVSGLLTCAARAKNYGRHPENTELPDDSLDEMFRTLEPLTNVNSEITRCILGEDEIADDASATLKQIRRSMKVTGERIPYTACRYGQRLRKNISAGRCDHHAKRPLLYPGQSRIQKPGIWSDP